MIEVLKQEPIEFDVVMESGEEDVCISLLQYNEDGSASEVTILKSHLPAFIALLQKFVNNEKKEG